MLLAIDAGNTNILFALCDGETILSRWRIATDPHRTADEYAVWLQQLLELQKRELADIDAVMIGTVVPRALHNLQTLARRYCNVEPLVAGDGKASWPMNLDVPEPETLGADRGLNIIAAHAAFEGDIVVIDFGTATTFDICDYTGAYKGGVIAPGINLSLDALTGKTAQLPKIAIEKPDDDSVVGTTTQSQMLIGVYWGYVAMIEGLLERTRKEIGRPVTVVATGGLSALFPEGLFDHIDFDLTIKGLILLHQQATNS